MQELYTKAIVCQGTEEDLVSLSAKLTDYGQGAVTWFCAALDMSFAAPHCAPAGATRQSGRRAPAEAHREHPLDEGSGIHEGFGSFIVRPGGDHFESLA